MDMIWSKIFDEIWKAAIGPAIAATVVWMILKFTPIGRRIWQRMLSDDVSKILVSIALFLSLTSIVLVAYLLMRSPSVVISSTRIGPSGVESQTQNPGIWTDMGAQGFQQIASAGKSQICTLSNIIVYTPVPGSAANRCQLHRDGDRWFIDVHGALQCRVTCFEISIQ